MDVRYQAIWSQRNTTMLNGLVSIYQLCANDPYLRSNSLRNQLTEPAGFAHTDIVIQQQKNFAFGLPRSGIVQGGIIKRAWMIKNSDTAISAGQTVEQF